MYEMSIFDNMQVASEVYKIFKDNVGNSFELSEGSELFKNKLKIQKNNMLEVFDALVTKYEYLRNYRVNIGVLKDVSLSAINLNIFSDEQYLSIEIYNIVKGHSEVSMFYGKETTINIIEIEGYFIVNFESEGLVQYFKFGQVNFEELIRNLSDIKH